MSTVKRARTTTTENALAAGNGAQKQTPEQVAEQAAKDKLNERLLAELDSTEDQVIAYKDEVQEELEVLKFFEHVVMQHKSVGTSSVAWDILSNWPDTEEVLETIIDEAAAGPDCTARRVVNDLDLLHWENCEAAGGKPRLLFMQLLTRVSATHELRLLTAYALRNGQSAGDRRDFIAALSNSPFFIELAGLLPAESTK